MESGGDVVVEEVGEAMVEKARVRGARGVCRVGACWLMVMVGEQSGEGLPMLGAKESWATRLGILFDLRVASPSLLVCLRDAASIADKGYAANQAEVAADQQRQQKQTVGGAEGGEGVEIGGKGVETIAAVLQKIQAGMDQRFGAVMHELKLQGERLGRIERAMAVPGSSKDEPASVRVGSPSGTITTRLLALTETRNTRPRASKHPSQTKLEDLTAARCRTRDT
eukprot:3937798-Rhodomonas_salina.1